jgi:hypothetical protein
MFKCLLHAIYKLLIPAETCDYNVIHLVFEIKQVLNHGLILLGIYHNCTPLFL